MKIVFIVLPFDCVPRLGTSPRSTFVRTADCLASNYRSTLRVMRFVTSLVAVLLLVRVASAQNSPWIGVEASPTDGGTVAVFSESSVAVSTDGTLNWRVVFSRSDAAAFIAEIAWGDDGSLFALETREGASDVRGTTLVHLGPAGERISVKRFASTASHLVVRGNLVALMRGDNVELSRDAGVTFREVLRSATDDTAARALGSNTSFFLGNSNNLLVADVEVDIHAQRDAVLWSDLRVVDRDDRETRRRLGMAAHTLRSEARGTPRDGGWVYFVDGDDLLVVRAGRTRTRLRDEVVAACTGDREFVVLARDRVVRVENGALETIYRGWLPGDPSRDSEFFLSSNVRGHVYILRESSLYHLTNRAFIPTRLPS